MRIRVYSVKANYGIGKLKPEYINILSKYNLESQVEIDINKFSFFDELQEIRIYYITIKSIKQLFELSKELKETLIIDYEDNSITIYDDYVE